MKKSPAAWLEGLIKCIENLQQIVENMFLKGKKTNKKQAKIKTKPKQTKSFHQVFYIDHIDASGQLISLLEDSKQTQKMNSKRISVCLTQQRL